MENIQEAIAVLAEHRALTREEAALSMRHLMQGNATDAQIGAFLTALRMNGVTEEEITGFAQTMREMSTKVASNRRPLVDTCGTGGDFSGTFNISTTAAFVVAGAGVAVAKHGNRSATSKCGSADVLETLGVNIEASPELVGKCIDEVGIGFLFARTLHGAMKHVAGPRKELGIRTVFNILGPLTNPAGACGQVMGVFDSTLVETLARVLTNLGTRRAFVVAGNDGLDELTLSGPSAVAEATEGVVDVYELNPEGFGLRRVSSDQLQGDTSETNAKILKDVLTGVDGPHRDIVLLNAAAAIIAGECATDWQSGIEAAKESIDSGAAMNSLEELIKVSNDS